MRSTASAPLLEGLDHTALAVEDGNSPQTSHLTNLMKKFNKSFNNTIFITYG